MALPLLVGAAGVAATLPASKHQHFGNRPVFIALFLALLAWLCLSSLWSPSESLERTMKLPALAILGLFFVAEAGWPLSARRTWAFASAAFVVLALLLAIEAGFGLPINRGANPEADFGEWVANPARGSVVLLALAWPAAAGLWLLRQRLLAGLALGVAGVLSLQFGMLALPIAFGIGLIAFAGALAAPRPAILIASAGLAIWMLAAPLLTPLPLSQQSFVDALPLSWAHRAAIWNHACAAIAEQPWFGHGLDAARAVRDEVIVRGETFRALPRHPHSASLHVWYELGAVGAALTAALIAYGGWRLAQVAAANRLAAAAAAATLASLGLIANVSYSAWQEWWLATMLIAAAAVSSVRHLSRDAPSSG